jgi:hypothetical protein
VKVDAITRARQVAKRVLQDHYDPLLACRDIMDISNGLSAVPREVMLVFETVESEVDTYPIGAEREYWAEDALRALDVKAEHYRARVRSEVEHAMRALLDALDNHP